jgi:hypothetical protein
MARRTIHCVVVPGIEHRDRRGERHASGIVSDLDLMRALRAGFEDVNGGGARGHRRRRH